MLPSSTRFADELGLSELEQSPRVRLLIGMLHAVDEKGYAVSTIADVVRHARMSKRTFYEHFPDKEACFLSAYAEVAGGLLGRIALAVREQAGLARQIEVAARTYFQNLEEHPALTRMLLSDIHAAGPAALASRRRIHQQFADLICAVVQLASGAPNEPSRLSRELATALVGGVNELVLLAIDEGRLSRLHELAPTAIALIEGAVSAANK